MTGHAFLEREEISSIVKNANLEAKKKATSLL
jgi:hypothetical protein